MQYLAPYLPPVISLPVACRRASKYLLGCLLGLACVAGAVRGQSFAAAVNYTVGSGSQAVALGDFNKDGKPDLATANSGSGSVSVLRGNGDGTFQTPVDYPTGAQTTAIATGDFNHDGNLDLIVADLTPNSYQSFSVLPGNGDGTFGQRVTSDAGPRITAMATGDFNGDGTSDLLTVYSDSNAVGVRLGRGDGALLAATYYGVGQPPRDLVVRDFNRDGKADVAVPLENSDPGSTAVAVLLGNGDGSLKSPVRYRAVTDFMAQITAGDYNGDGHLDLAATSTFSGGKISVLLGNGDGTFQARMDALGGGSDRLTTADLDVDGKPDVVTLQGRGTGTLGILGGNGDGTLRAVKNYSVNIGATDVATGDLNGDGKTDVVIADRSNFVSVLINQTSSLVIRGIVTDAQGVGMAGVNVSLKGDVTTAVATAADGSYSFVGLATGSTYTVTPTRQNYSFSPSQQVFSNLTTDQTANFTGTLRSYTISGTIRDGSGMGVAGVSVTLGGPVTLTTTTNSEGRYSFASLPGGNTYTLTPSMSRRLFTPTGQIIINLSSDRTFNFLVALATYTINVSVRDPNSNEYLINPTVTLSGTVNGTMSGISGTFQRLPVGGNYTLTLSQTSAPFTNFLLALPLSQTFNDLTANQNVNFNARVLSFPAGLNPGMVVPGDFDSDGKRDLVVSNHSHDHSTGSLSFLAGNGDGTLRPPVNIASGLLMNGVVGGDFNSDGKLDVAVTSMSGNVVGVLLGNGNGTFQPTVSHGVGIGPTGLTTGDLNGDGKLDLVSANSDTRAIHGVSVLIGNGDGTFKPKLDFTLSTAPPYVTTGDFNSDGKLDVIAGNSLLAGNGDGTLRAPVVFSSNANARDGAAADFNRDGKLDLATSSSSQIDDIRIFLGNGDGTFRPVINYRPTYRTSSVATADFNGDGNVDLVLTSEFSVTVLMGNGDGTFQDYTLYFFGNYYPVRVAAADLNNDGRPDLTFANIGGSEQVSVLLNQIQTGIQFSATNYTAREVDRRAEVTITRGGNTSASSTVSYHTIDNPASIRCDAVNGTAYARCDYATAVDTLVFAPGETHKTISVPLIDDSHVEGAETFQIEFSGVTDGILSGKRAVTVTILDNDTATSANPIFANEPFVRQQYLDFLSREPEPEGLEAWLRVLNNCSDVNNNPACDRSTVSAAFFGSQEFQLKGFYVYRFYAASLSRLPSYSEIITDMRSVTGQTAAEVFAKRAAFAADWVNRTDYKNLYNSMSNATFVNSLLNRYNLSQITAPDPQTPDANLKVTLTRSDLINRLDAGTLTRAQVLRALVESDEAAMAEFNRAFVAMQYFGYLRRDPEAEGYNAWLNYLNANPTDFRKMVEGFVNSTEYKLRFGQP